jgi:hypothetical protein
MGKSMKHNELARYGVHVVVTSTQKFTFSFVSFSSGISITRSLETSYLFSSALIAWAGKVYLVVRYNTLCTLYNAKRTGVS